MSDNKEKTKDVEELPEATRDPEEMFKDISELMDWMSSPRVYWDNFAVSLPVKKPSDVKWIQTRIEEA